MAAKPRVLVVDDDAEILTQLRWALQDDLDLVLASSPAEAESRLKGVGPEAALVDLHLPPDASGIGEGLALIRRLRGRWGVRIIVAISAQPGEEIARESRAAGATAFLSKPVERTRLLHLLTPEEPTRDGTRRGRVRGGSMRGKGKGMCFTIGASLVLAWGAAYGAHNLVTNGDFEGGFSPDGTGDSVPAGWTKHESRPAEGSTIGPDPSNGPSQPGSLSLAWSRPSGGSSGDRSGVEQNLFIDASLHTSLILDLDVRVESHDLEAGGTVTPAFEWPVMVEIRYTLMSNPATTQFWRHGWYVNPPGDGTRTADPGSGIIPTYNDTLVSAGVWTPASFDLFAELPDLGVITGIQVVGSGWSFAGAADNVRIVGDDRIWKAHYPNYSPSGMPDFDQRQGMWAHAILCGANLTAESAASGDDIQLILPGASCGSAHEPVIAKGPDHIMQSATAGDDEHQWEYCVPTSIASCLMWFDSKFEADLAAPPCDGADTYGLVQAYPAALDDHCSDNVNEASTPPGADPMGNVFGELVEDLAWRMDTGGQRSLTAGKHGTGIADAEAAVSGYLAEKRLFDRYMIRLQPDPDYAFVESELRKSQDLILALSFYQTCPGQPPRFLGGHAATAAGVAMPSDPPEICLSDPFLDMAEAGSTGRSLPPGLHPHFKPEMLHNDASFVSHDCYPVQPAASGFGIIALPQWGTVVPLPGQGGEERPQCDDISNFFGQNAWVPGDPAYTPPGGFCASEPLIPCNDFPVDPDCPPPDQTCIPEPPCDPDPSCVIEPVISFALEISPFFFKDGGWIDYAPSGVPDFDQRTDGGFVCPINGTISHCGPVAAADSMWWFDSKYEPFPVPPPAINDGFPLVADLTGRGDDHDTANATLLIKELADGYFNTNNIMNQRPSPYCGTYIDDMEAGLNKWLADFGLEFDFYVESLSSPTFEQVAGEVEQSNDVLLLLGFWQFQGGLGRWVRTGGHYVTSAGVDTPNQAIAFSDPGRDGAEAGAPGRVLGPQPHGTLGAKAHDDAENVSHDIYEAVPTGAPVGVWGPSGYVAALGLQLDEYARQNSSDALDQGDYHGDRDPLGPPPETVVEYALVVRPCPPDGDGDGVPQFCGDCDDTDPNVFLGAIEVCDGIDNDCDGVIDGGTVDNDGDGFDFLCDCNDADPNVFPGAIEVCDGIDNDCDPLTDEAVDSDGDGFTICGGDCNEGDPNISPGATEVCDGIDNDCDTMTDEGFDADSDGYTLCGGDCNDSDPNVSPAATEICDGIDNDCDASTDEGFFDTDGDGFGAACDCDDGDPGVYPGAPEICDAIDNNCDGVKDEGFADGDGDGAGDICDCDPADPNLWSAPAGPVRNVAMDHSRATGLATILWDPPSQPGAVIPLFDIFRALGSPGGPIPPGFLCLQPDGATTSYSTSTVAPAGSSHLYLLRPQTSCGTGPPGNVGGTVLALPPCP